MPYVMKWVGKGDFGKPYLEHPDGHWTATLANAWRFLSPGGVYRLADEQCWPATAVPLTRNALGTEVATAAQIPPRELCLDVGADEQELVLRIRPFGGSEATTLKRLATAVQHQDKTGRDYRDFITWCQRVLLPALGVVYTPGADPSLREQLLDAARRLNAAKRRPGLNKPRKKP